MHPSGPTQRVVVVGAGVSGCACAVALAEAGVSVTLVNSALDIVGLPGYGPDLWLSDREAWTRVPQRLRDAWERWSYVSDDATPLRDDATDARDDATYAPTDATPLVVTDRRAVSLETKQLIESFLQIDLRQGLVVDVRPSADGRAEVEVETAFGDIVRGTACVLAVGLGLGGRVTEGGREIAGARYGEVAADALYEVLRDRGALFAMVEREVGDHIVGWEPAGVVGGDLLGSGQALLLRRATLSEATRTGMPGEGLVVPPGPHEVAGAQRLGALRAGDGAPLGGPSHVPGAGIFPDEAATGEWYRSPGLAGEDGAPAQVVRGAHRVRGQVIVSLDADGRLQRHRRTWVVGQAAGARTYLDSLVDGVRGARAVAAVLLADRAEATTGEPDGRDRSSGPGGPPVPGFPLPATPAMPAASDRPVLSPDLGDRAASGGRGGGLGASDGGSVAPEDGRP